MKDSLRILHVFAETARSIPERRANIRALLPFTGKHQCLYEVLLNAHLWVLGKNRVISEKHQFLAVKE